MLIGDFGNLKNIFSLLDRKNKYASWLLDQHVSPALSSPPSIHSGFGGEKMPGIRISEENSESQNVSEDAAPCAQRSKKNCGYSKSEKVMEVFSSVTEVNIYVFKSP